MEYNIVENGNSLSIALVGRLDTETSQRITTELSDQVAQWQGKEVVVDCGELEYISSSGIRLLLLIRKNVGNSVSLKDVHPEILQILKVTHLDTMFTMI